MKPSRLFLPALVLGAAALITIPAVEAFNVINGVFRNADQTGFQTFSTSFADASANDNPTADNNFPGQTGSALSIWKAAVEWNSELRGNNGNGDPLNPGGLGSGNANFDFMYHGNVTSTGGQNSNVVFATNSTLGAGVYAVTGYIIGQAGWQIAFDDSPNNGWIWQDGPGNQTNFLRPDIQGVATHELGHALGLAHSADPNATMIAAAAETQTPAMRSINNDDIGGIQSIYGVKSATKPKITAISGNVYIFGFITITGTNFAATGNEVWFTKDYAGTPEVNTPPTPVKVTNISSNGTSLTVQIPNGVTKGDVIVRVPGSNGDHSVKSAPFPLNLQPPPPYPVVSSVSPDPIAAASSSPPVLTINGINFSTATSVSVGTRVYPTGQFVIVNGSKITVDFNPPPNESGLVNVSVTNPSGTSAGFPVTINLPANNYIFANKTNPAAGTDVTFYCCGPAPGEFPAIAYSQCLTPLPVPPYFTLSIGGCFDVNFLEGNPFLGPAGTSEFTVTVPSTFHGIVFLQFVRLNVINIALPSSVSNILTLIVP